MTRPLSHLARATPDPLDPHDTLYEVDFSAVVPKSVDLRPFMAPIEDQTTVGDCTANALVGNCEAFMYANNNRKQFSEDFNYYTSRYLLNGGKAPTGDLGSTPGMALYAAKTYGVCLETSWPISTSESVFNSQPPATAYNEAANYKVQNYQRINNPLPTQVPWWNSDYWWWSIVYALATGYPVNIAFNVGSAIFGLQPGQVYMPINLTNNTWQSGHDVLVVGYTMPDDQLDTLTFICRNSWGANWCDKGYFLMSPQVFTSDVLDAYVQQDFAGYTVIGPNTISHLPVPTLNSTCADIVTYVFKENFGRYPQPSGLNFWTTSVGNWLLQQIIAGAAVADQQYMAAHPVATPPVFTSGMTVAQVVNLIFTTYFGRSALPAGEAFWTTEALNYFGTAIVAAAGPLDQSYMADKGITLKG